MNYTLFDWLSGFRYIYRPGMIDRIDPTVIRGRPIAPESIVRVTNDRVDPLRWMVWIEDMEGNEQSVYRSALHRLRRPRR